MKNIAHLHRKIAPELIALIEERYLILRHIHYAQPIGRRALAGLLNMGERVVRAQVDFLKKAGLIEFSPLGMTVTAEGRATLSELAEYIRSVHGLTPLEEELSQELHLKRIVIIPGDSDADPMVQKELGRAAAGVLGYYLGNNMIVAVSGGSTMAHVAEAVQSSGHEVTVVPARGGLGEQVEYQANTIAASMAQKLGGSYRLLHVPDGVSEETLQAILGDDLNVRAVTEMIRGADILLHGIGQAAQMAKRRGMNETAIGEITHKGAVGEALGQYCDLHGHIVYETSSMGLRLDDLTGVEVVIAVAGGKRKAEAIVAVTAAGRQDVLITDEAAARSIQSIIYQLKKSS